MKVTFLALIKQITSKSLVALEKESRLILDFKPDDDILDKINRLHKADELVQITIEKVED